MTKNTQHLVGWVIGSIVGLFLANALLTWMGFVSLNPVMLAGLLTGFLYGILFPPLLEPVLTKKMKTSWKVAIFTAAVLAAPVLILALTLVMRLIYGVPVNSIASMMQIDGMLVGPVRFIITWSVLFAGVLSFVFYFRLRTKK